MVRVLALPWPLSWPLLYGPPIHCHGHCHGPSPGLAMAIAMAIAMATAMARGGFRYNLSTKSQYRIPILRQVLINLRLVLISVRKITLLSNNKKRKRHRKSQTRNAAKRVHLGCAVAPIRRPFGVFGMRWQNLVPGHGVAALALDDVTVLYCHENHGFPRTCHRKPKKRNFRLKFLFLAFSHWGRWFLRFSVLYAEEGQIGVSSPVVPNNSSREDDGKRAGLGGFVYFLYLLTAVVHGCGQQRVLLTRSMAMTRGRGLWPWSWPLPWSWP